MVSCKDKFGNGPKAVYFLQSRATKVVHPMQAEPLTYHHKVVARMKGGENRHAV